MSGQLRTLRNRIRSVDNTKKITRAMEMVAASKLRRFQEMMVKARPYTEGLGNLVGRVMSGHGGTDLRLHHPFFEQRDENRIGIVLITSDTGLCGSYNNDLMEKTKSFLGELRLSGRQTPKGSDPGNSGIRPLQLLDSNNDPIFIGVGKAGATGLKRMKINCRRAFTDIRASQIESIFAELKKTIEQLFVSREVDSVHVIYSHFINVALYQPVAEKILPLEKPATLNRHSDYIFEPSPEKVFEKLIPLYFEAKTRLIFLESFVSEQIARMRAMHQATENAKEMVDSLTLLRNKARQAMITKELIEVVSGSQALKK